jgi:hypothetical protein
MKRHLSVLLTLRDIVPSHFLISSLALARIGELAAVRRTALLEQEIHAP